MEENIIVNRSYFLKSFVRLFFTFFLFANIALFANSQPSNNFSTQLELLKNINLFCQENIKMNIGDAFYSNWSEDNEMYVYLYASDSNKIKSIYGGSEYESFGNRSNEAEKKKLQLDSLGFHTLLYKTYGNSATRITKGLLSYPFESISFIAFHEATHLHFKNNVNIPYSIEEAACDILGIYGTLELFEGNKKYSIRKAKKQVKLIENIIQSINTYSTYAEVAKTKELKIIYKNCQMELSDFLKNADQFKIDRYDYPVNNAYFLRYQSYCENYFKLKLLYLYFEDIIEFLDFIITLPNDKELAIEIIETKIKK